MRAALATLPGCLWLLLILTALPATASTWMPAASSTDSTLSQTTTTERLRVAFYNVENLFDNKHDSLKNDLDYLPEGRRHWTRGRYWTKLNHVAEVIASIGDDRAPDLVGLCEVENDSSLYDLVRRSSLRSAGYRYVMSHGDDPRGIDVALLYNPVHFHLLQTKEHPVPVHTVRPDAHARPVLHVSGVLLSGDTLDILVCHWPSRLRGTRASEPLRRLAASVVQAVCDSLQAVRPAAFVVVMGDLNEPPSGRAVTGLEAASCLVNLAHTVQPAYTVSGKTDVKGSYRYKGRWEQLDQMLISPSLSATLFLYNAPFLLEKEPLYGGRRPFRTFHGLRYQSGYSDHLPIYADIRIVTRY